MSAPKSPNPRFDSLDDAMDRLFDRELDADEREALADQLESDPSAMKEFREMTDILVALRDPIETPDMTAQTLARLDDRPRFAPRSRSMFSLWRLAAAAALVGSGAGIVLLQQYEPQEQIADSVDTRSDPIDEVVSQIHDPVMAAKEIEILRSDPAYSKARFRYLALDAPPIDLKLTSPLITPFDTGPGVLVPELDTGYAGLTPWLSGDALASDEWKPVDFKPYPLEQPRNWPGPIFPSEQESAQVLDWNRIQFERPSIEPEQENRLLIYTPDTSPVEDAPDLEQESGSDGS